MEYIYLIYGTSGDDSPYLFAVQFTLREARETLPEVLVRDNPFISYDKGQQENWSYVQTIEQHQLPYIEDPGIYLLLR